MLKILSSKPVAVPVSFICICSILLLSFKGREAVTLNAGTPIPMETVQTTTSKLLMVGKTIDFRVTQNIEVEGEVVVPAGSIAKGQVVRVSKAKGLGKAGYIAVEMKTVQAVDGSNIMITGGDIYQEGEDQEGLALVLGLVVCILFLTIKGKEAIIPSGYAITPSVAISMEIEV